MKPHPERTVTLWLERGDDEVEVTATYEPDGPGYVYLNSVTGPDGKPFEVTPDEEQRFVEAAAEEEGERAVDAAERYAEAWED